MLKVTHPNITTANSDSDARLVAEEVAKALLAVDSIVVAAARLHEVALVRLVLDVAAPAVHGGVAVRAVVARRRVSGGDGGNGGGEGRGEEGELHGGKVDVR